MHFSSRTKWITKPNELSLVLNSKRKRGEAIIDLTESNPTRCTFLYIKEHLLKPFLNLQALFYEPSPRGHLEARRAVCDYYREMGIRVELEQVFLTAGTSEAYSFIFRLLAEPGEGIAVANPSYPLFEYLADINDVKTVSYPLAYESATGWRLSIPVLEETIKKNPKAFIVVNPNNPTGHYTQGADRIAVNRSCRAAGIPIIADEVFLDYRYEAGKNPPSFAGNEEALTFTLSGISKMLGMPQMKLSWIVVSGGEVEERRQAMERLEIIADTYLSVATPGQLGLPYWLTFRREIVAEIRSRVAANLLLLKKILSGRKVEILKADGGWYAVIAYSGQMKDQAMAVELLEKHDVLVWPGYFFDFPGDGYLIVSLLPLHDIFREGVERLSRAFSSSN